LYANIEYFFPTNIGIGVRKKEIRNLFFGGCGFLMWTSQGLNLGPPDYESVKVIFFKISQNIFLISIWLFIRYLLTLQPK